MTQVCCCVACELKSAKQHYIMLSVFTARVYCGVMQA